MPELNIKVVSTELMSPKSIEQGHVYCDLDGDAYLRTDKGCVYLETGDCYCERAPFFAAYGPYTDQGTLKITR